MEDYRNLGSEEGERVRSSHQEYYWLLAQDPKSGKSVILGPYVTEDDANRIGFVKLAGSFEVIPLPTRDPGKATKMLKYRRFHQTAKLEEALKRAKHQPTKGV